MRPESQSGKDSEQQSEESFKIWAKPSSLIPEGTYRAVITEIEAPKRSKTGKTMFIGVTLISGDYTLKSYITGSLQMCLMIYRNRHLFVGMDIEADVKHVRVDFSRYVFASTVLNFNDPTTEANNSNE